LVRKHSLKVNQRCESLNSLLVGRVVKARGPKGRGSVTLQFNTPIKTTLLNQTIPKKKKNSKGIVKLVSLNLKSNLYHKGGGGGD